MNVRADWKSGLGHRADEVSVMASSAYSACVVALVPCSGAEAVSKRVSSEEEAR